jgi:hypothetical protein
MQIFTFEPVYDAESRASRSEKSLFTSIVVGKKIVHCVEILILIPVGLIKNLIKKML